MTTLREAAQQALGALVDAQNHNYALQHKEADQLINALRAALAEQPLTELPPLPEPAGKLYSYNYTADQMRDYARAAITKAEENT